jgi:hypothetical protein
MAALSRGTGRGSARPRTRRRRPPRRCHGATLRSMVAPMRRGGPRTARGRPANVSLIHRRCRGPSAAPGRDQPTHPEPDHLTPCSMSDAHPDTSSTPRPPSRAPVPALPSSGAAARLPCRSGNSGVVFDQAAPRPHFCAGSACGVPLESGGYRAVPRLSGREPFVFQLLD